MMVLKFPFVVFLFAMLTRCKATNTAPIFFPSDDYEYGDWIYDLFEKDSSKSEKSTEVNLKSSEEELGNSSRTIYVSDKEPSCLSENSIPGLCLDDSEYDSDVTEKFKLAMKKEHISKEVRDHFFDLMVDVPKTPVPRFGNNFLEDPVCDSREHVLFPKRGLASNNTWVFILNQGDMRQGFRVGVCLNRTRNSRFRSASDSLCGRSSDDTGIESTCRQKHIYRKMITMHPNGTRVAIESILIPSCCICNRRASVARFGQGGDFFSDYSLQDDGESNEGKFNEPDFGLDEQDLTALGSTSPPPMLDILKKRLQHRKKKMGSKK